MYVNHSELAIIIDCSKNVVYNQFNYNDLINLDIFIDKHKGNLKLCTKKFSNRLLKNKKYLTAKDINRILGLTYYDLQKLRLNKKIKYKKIYAKCYLYDIDSLKILYPKYNFKTFIPTKEFYKVSEAYQILKFNNLNFSLRTLYRYLEEKKIPCILFGKNYRIPILEFENYIKKNKQQ